MASGGDPVPCKNGCGFYGNGSFDFYCSKCFKEISPKVESVDVACPVVAEEPENPKKKNRCRECNRRVGLTGFSCRCGGLFCSEHRYEKEHNCNFDFKSLERDLIRKNNPAIQAAKIDRV